MGSGLAGLPSRVVRASELGPGVAGLGTDRTLPVLPQLTGLFPVGALRRGSTVTVSPGGAPGATSLMLALLAEASRVGSWCAIVGVPEVNPVAAAELGIALDRLALVPHPGVAFDKIVATLLDGFDIVVAAPARLPSPSVRTQLAARARQHGCVLVPFRLGHAARGQMPEKRRSSGDAAYGWPPEGQRPGGSVWDGADLSLSTEQSLWHGLDRGRGRLRSREMTVCARGRGAGARPRHVTLWLPGPPVEQPPQPRLVVVR